MQHASFHLGIIEDERMEEVRLCTLPDAEGDTRAVLALEDTDIHVYVPDILGEGTPRAGDGDKTRLDTNLDALWHDKL
jgi:hypothetical protein